MRVALIASSKTPTNVALARAGGATWDVLAPAAALGILAAGDIAIGRLDVLPTLDGIDKGLWVLGALEARGITVLNGPGALLPMHDKLLTSRLLVRAGLPHPSTRLHLHDAPPPCVAGSVVVKPRFGSWGRDIVRCDNAASLAVHLDSLVDRDWFRRHGALVQTLVPPRGYDLRIVVAAGRVVGAVIRVSPDGEWRTNVSLGAKRVATTAPPEAASLAVAAAQAVGAELVGVDLLPTPRGGWTILELNGAVEFNEDYARRRDVFRATAALLTSRAADLCEVLPQTARWYAAL
jgi:[lysine-biosynthesis-protein LysW]---L-2-aminoadipate ligase